MSSEFQVFSYIGLMYAMFSLFIWRRKKIMDHMQLMTSTMAIGMMIGLIAGMIFGAINQGDLYTSTLWAMVLGGGLGMLFGMPISIVCVIEGALSGIMAGMMGAMLGEMVPASRVEPFLFLFLMIYTACILILVKVNGKEAAEGKSRFLTIDNPLISSGVLIIVFFWFQSLSFPFQSEANMENKWEEVNLVAGEFSYKPNQLVLKKGVPAKIIFTNNGEIEHDFELISSENFIVESASNMDNHQHDAKTGNKVHLHAKPGEKTFLVLKAKDEGKFQFYCTIPGHKENGMIGTITVL